jgi:hypothetical protein
MGVTSIIAILVILVLIVFAALSITTAEADRNLSEKTAESVTDYYKADSEAERIFAKIADAVSEGNDWQTIALSAGCTLVEVGSDMNVAYATEISDDKELHVELLITDEQKIIRTLWQIVPTATWEAGEDLNLVQF